MLSNPIEKYATKEVISIKSNETIGFAINQMVKYRFQRLVVLDESGVVGLITASDILDALNQNQSFAFIKDEVKSIMSKNLTVVEKGSTVKNAILVMFNQGISCLPLVEGNRLAGIFTVKDCILFDALWDSIQDGVISVEEGIGRRIDATNAISEENTLWEAATIMINNGIRQLLVRNTEATGYIGILTAMSLLKAITPSLIASGPLEHVKNIKIKHFDLEPVLSRASPTVVSSVRFWMMSRGTEAVPILHGNKAARLITERDLFGYLSMKIQYGYEK